MESIYDPKPLDAARQEIRLLSVANDGRLRGELSVSSLADRPRYSALSYVWGDAAVRMPICLDGVDITVTRNLSEALARLASEDKTQSIWVDALCINQADAAEKESQIQLMRNIYSMADTTYIWLGEAADDSDLAMDMMSAIKGEHFQKYDPEDPAWRGLELLFQRGWWRRTWVIQESILSPRPLVKCGTKEVEFERFVEFNYLFDEYLKPDPTRFANLSWFFGVPYRDMLWRDIKKWTDGQLANWLPYMGRFECTEIRDKIYALLGFIHELSRRFIQVDYRTKAGTREYLKSDGQVLTEATVLLFAEHGLGILQYLEGERDTKLDLPSWCADWTRYHKHVPLSPLGFSAYNLAKANIEIKPWLLEGTSVGRLSFLRFSTDFRTLGVRGFIVDTIVFFDRTPGVPVDQPWITSPTQCVANERTKLTLEACKRWESHVLLHHPNSYGNSGGCLEAFWKTVIADKDWRHAKASSALRSNFDAWMGRPDPKVRSMTDSEIFAYENEYRYPAVAMCRQRCFITTANGYFGLAPYGAQTGDLVCVLRGGTVPVILRRISDKESFTIIGESYIHGIMDGEFVQNANPESLKEFWIT